MPAPTRGRAKTARDGSPGKYHGPEIPEFSAVSRINCGEHGAISKQFR